MIRRTLLLSVVGLVVVGVAGSARAEMSLGQVCKQLIGSQVTQCMAAANGRFIDGNAAATCAKLIGGQVTTCVGAIAGKDYSRDEADACGGLIGAQVVDCLRTTGRPHVDRRAPPPPPPVQQQPVYGDRDRYRDDRRGGGLSNADIRAEVAAALEALRANDPISAERRLRRLLNDMR
jgi:hypothetical protein